jgi:DNA invertase Pin-like site-specific DNA recombinase
LIYAKNGHRPMLLEHLAEQFPRHIQIHYGPYHRDQLFEAAPKSAIFMDKVSGAKTERTGLTKCLETLTGGDILVVWRLDRLGRSMRHLITLVEDLRSKGIGFRSLNEGAIDTTCASGELIFNIFSALAQFERRLILERTKAGLAAARARGRHGGRPRVTPAEAKVVLAKKLNADKTLDIDDVCKTLRISRSTFYRYVRL